MPPKKRGRKPKAITQDTPKIPKKRGRKPKGGKIITKINEVVKPDNTQPPNIILQLKCNSKDLYDTDKNNPDTPEVDHVITSYSVSTNKQATINYEQYNNISYIPSPQNTCEDDGEDTEIKEIWEKLRILKHKLHLNEVSDKRPDCFYCTCSFDNPPVYIPEQ